jgi:hydroxymethylpyrimidine pyrophosphatase-like HAD family hydrolase
MLETDVSKEKADILVVFSDLDGTLIHYPNEIPKSRQMLKLPPSSTGMRGIISAKTLVLVQEIRQKGVKFVLVSGMRTSTLLSRLPYLPRADAYCTEAGGRIFYPTDDLSSKDVFVVKPQKYDGAVEKDLNPFGLVEDQEWRNRMEQDTGKFGSASLKDLASNPTKMPSLNERDGLLWDFARNLITKGYVLDTKGYSACFRVNKKQQTTVSDDEFQALLDGRVTPWSGLSTSVNLSCIDFYPATSGKKNW